MQCVHGLEDRKSAQCMCQIKGTLGFIHRQNLSIICCARNKVRWVILEENVVVKAFRSAQTDSIASKMAFAGEVSPLSFHCFSAHSCKASIHMFMQVTTVSARCCGVIIKYKMVKIKMKSYIHRIITPQNYVENLCLVGFSQAPILVGVSLYDLCRQGQSKRFCW